MNIGSVIQSYAITAMTGGYVMGESPRAPSPYVVWQVDDDGAGVCCGHYFNDREEAEWDFCARAFEWFEDNVNVHMIEDDEEHPCDGCRYNTNDYVCHPHCSGCDGKSHFEKKPFGRGLICKVTGREIKPDGDTFYKVTRDEGTRIIETLKRIIRSEERKKKRGDENADV